MSLKRIEILNDLNRARRLKEDLEASLVDISEMIYGNPKLLTDSEKYNIEEAILTLEEMEF